MPPPVIFDKAELNGLAYFVYIINERSSLSCFRRQSWRRKVLTYWSLLQSYLMRQSQTIKLVLFSSSMNTLAYVVSDVNDDGEKFWHRPCWTMIDDVAAKNQWMKCWRHDKIPKSKMVITNTPNDVVSLNKNDSNI